MQLTRPVLGLPAISTVIAYRRGIRRGKNRLAPFGVASAKAAQEKVLADALAEAKSHPRHLLAHVVLAETVTVQIDADAVAQLGAASKIESKICNNELMASTEFVTVAHEFACKVAQSGGALTPVRQVHLCHPERPRAATSPKDSGSYSWLLIWLRGRFILQKNRRSQRAQQWRQIFSIV